MSYKYKEAMVQYLRAKMWKNAYVAKKCACRIDNKLWTKMQISLFFFYEILKSVSGYTAFAYWYAKKKRKQK